MQAWGIDTMILAGDQRPWCAAGLLGSEDGAISYSGNAVAGDE